ncbi:MAG: hypothetical protein ABIA21_00595 [Candidatus Aenigmatarchaeota archaeon]
MKKERFKLSDDSNLPEGQTSTIYGDAVKLGVSRRHVVVYQTPDISDRDLSCVINGYGRMLRDCEMPYPIKIIPVKMKMKNDFIEGCMADDPRYGGSKKSMHIGTLLKYLRDTESGANYQISQSKMPHFTSVIVPNELLSPGVVTHGSSIHPYSVISLFDFGYSSDPSERALEISMIAAHEFGHMMGLVENENRIYPGWHCGTDVCMMNGTVTTNPQYKELMKSGSSLICGECKEDMKYLNEKTQDVLRR